MPQIVKPTTWDLRFGCVQECMQHTQHVARVESRPDFSRQALSFLDDERWTYSKGETMPLRTIFRVATLLDISPVTFPAYAQTTASA
jgi:phage head maturation protease